MSFNQSRGEKNESLHYRKSGRPVNSNQHKNLPGSTGKGGGGVTAPPPSRSYNKKVNNAQGGQSRVNSDFNKGSAVRTEQNGAQLQPPLHGASDPSVTSVTVKPTDVSTQKITRGVPKAPSSNTATVSSDIHAPIAPPKAPGDATQPLSLQFGSIRPDIIKGMQVPARTSSAPPNIDEQTHDQTRHDSVRTKPALPTVPQQQYQRRDAGPVDQSNTVEAHPIFKAKGDVQVSGAPAVTQTQNPSVNPISGTPMQMPFHQPPLPIQFGDPNPQMQHPMPLPLPPLPLGNPSQLQQQVFVQGLRPHLMQSQGIMHQSQTLNFLSQMGPPQLLPQMGNLGITFNPQFQQQQAGKLSVPCRTVKITHPDTHEELRLDKRADRYTDGGSSGPRPHHNMSQPQPISSFQSTHSINCFPSSYYGNPLYFPPPTSTQVTTSSQPPRFYNQVSQGSPSVAFMNPSSLNPISANKTGAPLHGMAEQSNLGYVRDVHSVTSLLPSASVHVTVKPAPSSHGERVADPALSTGPTVVGKGDVVKIPKPHGETGSVNPQNSLQNSKSSSASEPSKPSVSAAASISAEGPTVNSLCSASPSIEDSTSVVSSSLEGTRRQTFYRSTAIKDEHKKPDKKKHSPLQNAVGGQSTSDMSSPSQPLKLDSSVNDGIDKTVEATTTPASSGASDLKLKSAGGVRTSESVEKEPETMGSKKHGDIMLSEESKPDRSSSEIIPDFVSLKSSEPINKTEQNSDIQVTSPSNETKFFETAEKKLEDSVGCGIEEEMVGNLVVSTSTDSKIVADTESVTSDKESTLVSIPSLSEVDRVGNLVVSSSTDSKVVADTESIMSDKESTLVSIPSLSEATLRREGEVTENRSTGLISPSPLGTKDKPSLEQNKSKNTTGKVKKKKKDILQKADAAGTTFDLYNAYKGPEENKQIVASAESTESASNNSSKQVSADASQDVSNEKGGQSKAELDDWEDAADISTPRLETSVGGKQVHDEDGNGVMAKKYSRDFLLKFWEHCTDPPEDFKIIPEIKEIVFSNVNDYREPHPSPGRIIDRPIGGSRRGSGMGDDDKWSKLPGPPASGRDMWVDIGNGGNLVGFRPGQGGNYGVLRNPRGQMGPVQYAGGILSGPMQSPGPHGGMQRNSFDTDRWQRTTSFQKGLMPSPRTPLQVMHRAEKKYEVGKVTDEEQAKQRQLKGILNKLTPQNFEKLFEKVKQVNIDNAGTLTGVISQIFDKALMEPTFCEMYADFCYHLDGELPDFNEDNEKITFKRLLLNKCQEEFERGVREQEEANRVDDEGEAKQSEEEREEKRIRARRRMLGNIRLIGELYKKKMLTERIMHECIKTLLGEYQNPDEENIESLCKLMSTIGAIIDHPKAKEHMDAYFDMMAKLSDNMSLSSRVRFMLKDSIDLRKNRWQQRRKVEGPKKIEDVHRDAAQERQAQSSRLARGPSINSSVRRGPPMEFAPRGSNVSSSPNTHMGGYRGMPQQLRGYGTQDIRSDERHSYENRTLSVPLSQRHSVNDSITLGPQGGLARGMSIRGQPLMPNTPLVDIPSPGDSRRVAPGLNGYNSVSQQTAYGSREDLIPRNISVHDQWSTQDRSMNNVSKDIRNTDYSFDTSLRTSSPTRDRGPTLTHSVSSEKMRSEEHLRDMSIEAIKEFYSAKDEKEVVLCIEDLNSPSFYPSMISIWVNDSFERKDKERDLLAKLLINLTKSRDIMLNQDQLIKGFASVLSTLEDAVNDAPKAAEFLGRILAEFVVEKVIPMAEIGRLIYEGGEEQGRLVEIGLAAEVLGSILEIIKSEKGEPFLNEIRRGSNLRLENFRALDSKKSWRLDKFM